ncbi:hypothetical protein XAP6164_1710022 [Xanthomonas phaseoli pv. phaseoli]|nr:hypothetical protein XAP6164_1710022 [Xanthomonas phaseoli pv. phaseoli]
MGSVPSLRRRTVLIQKTAPNRLCYSRTGPPRHTRARDVARAALLIGRSWHGNQAVFTQ